LNVTPTIWTTKSRRHGETHGPAFGSYDPPGGRAANIHFVAANVSWKVAQYLQDHPGPWNELPLLTVQFIDMQAVQRNRLLRADIHPPFRPEEVECFTEREIRSFGARSRRLCLSTLPPLYNLPVLLRKSPTVASYIADFLVGDSASAVHNC